MAMAGTPDNTGTPSTEPGCSDCKGLSTPMWEVRSADTGMAKGVGGMAGRTGIKGTSGLSTPGGKGSPWSVMRGREEADVAGGGVPGGGVPGGGGGGVSGGGGGGGGVDGKGGGGVDGRGGRRGGPGCRSGVSSETTGTKEKSTEMSEQ